MGGIKLQAYCDKGKTKDGDPVSVPMDVMKLSITLNEMLESCGYDDTEDSDGEPIPVYNVDEKILHKIIAWMTHHKDDPPPPAVVVNNPTGEMRTDDISPWDLDFLNVPINDLFEMLLAANYLNIPGLLDVTCKTVANMIKGKSPEEIRSNLHIENDFSESEKEQIYKECAWSEDE